MQGTLNYKEQEGYHIDQVLPWNIQVVLKVGLKASPAKLKDSLDVLQQTHPRLRVYIEKRFGIPRFVKTDAPIPMEFYPYEGEQQVLAVEKQDMKVSFTQRKNPLVQFRVFLDENNTYIICTISHVIADGFSMACICRDFLTHYLHGHVPKEREVVASLYPYFAKAPLLQRLQYAFERVKMAKYKPHIRRNPGILEIYETLTKRVLLDAATVTEIERICSKNKIAIHNLLTSIAMNATQKVLPKEIEQDIALISPVNLRKAASSRRITNEDIGLFSGVMVQSFVPSDYPSVMDFSKAIQAGVFTELKNKQYLKGEHSEKTLMNWPYYPNKVVVNFFQASQPVTLVSVLVIDVEEGDDVTCLRLNACQAFSVFYPYAFVNLLIFNRGTIFWDITYGHPNTSEALAESYRSELYNQIQQLFEAEKLVVE